MEQEYYSKQYIKHLLRENCKDREFAVIGKRGAIRALKFKNLFDFERILKLVNWGNQKQNFYRSIARLREIPEFTFNPKKRSSETGSWFREKFDNLIYSYDLFFDFDKDKNSTIYDVLKEVKELLHFFDEYELSYFVQFSGSKGFQIFIDGEYMPEPKIINGQVQPHKKIGEKIKEGFNFKYLDLRNNGVGNRLCKIPYSLVGNNVALPLNDFQLENFKEYIVKKEYVEREIYKFFKRRKK